MRTQPLGRLRAQQALDRVGGMRVDAGGDAQLAGGDALKGEVLGGRAEGRFAHQHLVDDAAQRPQVGLRTHGLIPQRLRRPAHCAVADLYARHGHV